MVILNPSYHGKIISPPETSALEVLVQILCEGVLFATVFALIWANV